MSAQADDIERMLQSIENRQVRCPECGGTDAHIQRATYELAPVRFPLTGGIIVGETHDYTTPPAGKFPSMLVCHNDACKHEWPVPDDVKYEWESVICECEEAKLRREHELKVLASAEGPLCENGNCGQPCIYVIGGTNSDGIPFGRWAHVDTRGLAGENKCSTLATGANGTTHQQYARITKDQIDRLIAARS